MREASLAAPRFTIQRSDTVELVYIPAPRRTLLIVFLSFWLILWTMAGIMVSLDLMKEFQAAAAGWLIGWVFGWIFVAITLSWMLTGYETLRIVGTDLEIMRKSRLFSRRKLFRGSDVKDLKVVEGRFYPKDRRMGLPFLFNGRDGAIRLDYKRGIYRFAAGLNEDEASQIVNWLTKRLPKVAT